MASKLENLKKSIANLREKTAPTMKTSAMSVGGGAIANIAYGVASDRIGVLQSAWYYEPLVLFAVGHMLRKKHHDLGVGVLGAAGYALAQNSRIGATVRGAVAQGIGNAGDAGAPLDQNTIAQAIAQSVGANLAQLIAQRSPQLAAGGYGGGYSGAGDAGAMYAPDASGMVSDVAGL